MSRMHVCAPTGARGIASSSSPSMYTYVFGCMAANSVVVCYVWVNGRSYVQARSVVECREPNFTDYVLANTNDASLLPIV